MHILLPFIVAGIATGSIYGLASCGLVLTYKTSGIFNLGHGALATVAAYLFYAMHDESQVNWVVAFVVAVFVAGPLLGVVMELISRQLALRSIASKIVATTGLVLFVQGLATVAYGSDTIYVEQFLPSGSEVFRFGGVNISYGQLTVTLVGLVAVLGLHLFFRRSRAGLSMRAVVDDADLLAMQSASPVRVRRVAWIIGSTFAALSGVLVLPFIGLNAIGLTYLVVQAFGAAAIGAFGSIALTYVGAIVLGVAASVSQEYVLNVGWLSGLPGSLPFIVLFAMLLLLPRRKLARPLAAEQLPAVPWRAPARVRLASGVVAVGALALIPAVAGDKIGFYTIGLTQVIMLLSLGLLVKTSGQVSLCHAAFAAIGAVAFSQLTLEHNVPWMVALLLSGLIVVPAGAIVAVPAIRLSGLFLALATFGFGILVEQMLYRLGFMFTTLSSRRSVPRPSFGEGDRAYFYVVLVITVITALVVVVIHETRLGRLMRGLADSPVAVTTMGLSTNVTRVIVFCISAFFAAVSGVLYAASVHFASSGDAHFTSFQSLVLLAVLALSPFAEPWYALFGLIAAVLPAYLTNANIDNWLNALFGALAITVSLRNGFPAMPERLKRVLKQLGGDAVTEVAEPVKVPIPVRRAAPGAALEVRDLRVAFGGLVAVDGVTFHVPFGRITGLVGPNGAGKTTTFDACSGLNRRVSGVVRLRGRDVTSFGAAHRGRLGLGRTFQRIALCDGLTVAENVALGRESGFAGRSVLSQVVSTRLQRRETRSATDSALQLCGIADIANRQAGALSTGQRRLVELARCLAGRFDILLLDEPAAGLDHRETEALDAVLRRVLDERDCAVLLVEHDMGLVMNVCDYLYVLDFGRLIFEGDPASVAASAEVQAAYLGHSLQAGAAEDESVG